MFHFLVTLWLTTLVPCLFNVEIFPNWDIAGPNPTWLYAWRAGCKVSSVVFHKHVGACSVTARPFIGAVSNSYVLRQVLLRAPCSLRWVCKQVAWFWHDWKQNILFQKKKAYSKEVLLVHTWIVCFCSVFSWAVHLVYFNFATYRNFLPFLLLPSKQMGWGKGRA